MNEGDFRGRRLPTLPLGVAVPSAQTGLTSLFGMVRGGPRRHGHLNCQSAVAVFSMPVIKTAYG